MLFLCTIIILSLILGPAFATPFAQKLPQTLDDIATTTVQASTITTTVTSTQVVTETPSNCSVDVSLPHDIESVPWGFDISRERSAFFTTKPARGLPGAPERQMRVLITSRVPVIASRTLRVCAGVTYDFSLYYRFQVGGSGLFTASYEGSTFLIIDSTKPPTTDLLRQVRGVFQAFDDSGTLAFTLTSFSTTESVEIVIDEITITPRSAVDSASI